jgi:hypothetical protein
MRRQRLTAARRTYRRLRKRFKRANSYLWLGYLRLRNRFGRGSVIGSSAVIVSLTSYGQRVPKVAFTIESLAAGRARPQQLILWLDDEQVYRELPPALRRLERRGLDIRLTDNLGPHTKYYPSLPVALDRGVPLVTADDDILYPRSWLLRLESAHRSDPAAIHCYWASVIGIRGGVIEPYATWRRCHDSTASPRHFATGVSGVLYPTSMVLALQARGTAFLSRCPRADDIWLHWVALNEGIGVRQLARTPRHFPLVPGTQQQTLLAENVQQGGNDRWIQGLYTAADINRMAPAPAVSSG